MRNASDKRFRPLRHVALALVAIAGAVAALSVAGLVRSGDLPPEGKYDRIVIDIGKANLDFKLNVGEFTCQSTGETVGAAFFDHEDDQNPPPNIHNEVWAGTFSNLCIGVQGVSFTLNPTVPTNALSIKNCLYENTTTFASTVCHVDPNPGVPPGPQDFKAAPPKPRDTSTPTVTPTATPPRVPTDTPEKDPKMSLRVYADKEKSELVCGQGVIHRECDLPEGGAFSVDVVADVPPSSGYMAYVVVLQYPPGLTLQQQPGLDENRAKACLAGSESKEEGRYRLNCKTGKTHYRGPLANVQFECNPEGGVYQIDLVGGKGTGGSYYVRPTIFGSLIFLKSQMKDGKPVADAVVVSCPDTGDPDPTPTISPTPTPFEVIPTPQARMSLRVYADKEKTELVCGQGDVHRECILPEGGAFSVDVMAEAPPLDGYTAYAVVLQYAGDVGLQQQPGLDENRAKECIAGSESKEEGRYRLNCKTGRTNYTGPLTNVQFECGPLGGAVQIDLVGGEGAGASYYVWPSIFGNLVFLKSEGKGEKAVADSVLVQCPRPPPELDSDSDGCSDAAELGDDPYFGGQRDPNDPWDFFDTPDPRLPAGPPAYQRDGVINLLDVLRVGLRFGPGDSNRDLLSPVPASGYHPAYDRGNQVGAHNWNRSPADGAITVPDDILGVAAQFAHNCG